MPVYEFYCQDCNVMFNFFSRKINTEAVPSCPRCKREKLEKYMSLFSSPSGEINDDEEEPSVPHIDESKVEKAMKMLDKEAENINNDDPKEATQVMRKLTDMMGIKMGAGMQEAFDRLEAGEDPEQVESEMGDVLEKELLAQGLPGNKAQNRRHALAHDETLYDLEKYVISDNGNS